MKYKVDGWNNFCRVFRLPEEFSPDFCFGGGIATNFQMVDWFQPCSGLDNVGCSREVWIVKVGPIKEKIVSLEDLEAQFKEYREGRKHIQPCKHLVIFDFGASLIF